jgi:acetyltransferase-like isoleucine patch superfamily enzyme
MQLSALSKYSLYSKIYIIICTILTKIFYPNARLIRFPLDIRNSKNIKIGKNFTCGHYCRIEACNYDLEKTKKSLIIGDNVEINDFVHISAYEKIEIGNDVLLASKIYISDLNHGNFNHNFQYDVTVPHGKQKISSKSIIIEDNVWIGESVCVLGGVTIGRGSIIGAMSNVTKSIPAYSIAVGNPAKIIKQFDVVSKTWGKINNEQ